MHAQVFYRTFNKVAGRGRTMDVDVDVPETATVVDMIKAASLVCGRTLMSRFGQIGVFEIQTDFGIWSHGDSERCLLTKGATFKTWDELDLEEA